MDGALDISPDNAPYQVVVADFASGAATWLGRTRRLDPTRPECIRIVARGAQSAREAPRRP